MSKKFRVSFADSLKLKDRPDAHLLLLANRPTSGMDFDEIVIPFSSRLALESFNKKADLRAVVRTVVPKGCAVYRHQKEE